MQSICNNCKINFDCQVKDISKCWCNSYPNILSAQENESCLCASCLHQCLIEKIKSITNGISKDDAQHNNWIKDLPKPNKILEGIDYTIENGFYVFTKWFHLKRGYCCGNGCRNCAY